MVLDNHCVVNIRRQHTAAAIQPHASKRWRISKRSGKAKRGFLRCWQRGRIWLWLFAFARKCSSTKMRIAEDRLPTCRPLSIFAIKFDTEHPCARAISRKPDQNVSSRLTLLLCP